MEWSPAKRFVSGSAPAGVQRPFVDVQSVLCFGAHSPRVQFGRFQSQNSERLDAKRKSL